MTGNKELIARARGYGTNDSFTNDLIDELADALEAAEAKYDDMRATAKDHYEQSGARSDKLVLVRGWLDENQVHEVYLATDDQAAECTDECSACALDAILSAPIDIKATS